MTALPEPLTKRAIKDLRRKAKAEARAKAKGEPRALPSRHVEMPTPERIAHAGEGYRSVIVDGERRTRVDDAPFDRMRARHQLHADEDINAMLYEAGERWLRDWYLSGLSGVGAINYGRAGMGEGDTPWSMPVTERSMKHRQAFRAARLVLSEEERTIVGGIVLDQRTAYDIGREVFGTRRRVFILDAAMEALRGGLKALARHYGLGRA
jgi:hypothetical protein